MPSSFSVEDETTRIISLRIPSKLQDALREIARRERRSLSAQILVMLEGSDILSSMVASRDPE